MKLARANPSRRLPAGGNPPALLVSFVCFLALNSSTRVVAQTPDQVLRSAAEVRRLPPAEAEKHLPVRFKAVVTFHDGALYSRFVQDETAGIYLQETTNMPPFGAGQLVEVEGETGAGEYAPIVILRSIKVLGDAELPAAKPVSLEELVSGREDSQFVEVVGTVRSVRFEAETQNYLVDLVIQRISLTMRLDDAPGGASASVRAPAEISANPSQTQRDRRPSTPPRAPERQPQPAGTMAMAMALARAKQKK